MNKIKTKIFAAILCLSLLFTPMINNYAHAQWITTVPISDFFTGLTSSGTWVKLGQDIGTAIANSIAKLAFTGVKIAALLGVQAATKAVIGSSIITDYNQYLYVSPQQIAMANMNTFFNTVSRGRASALNYEGVGPNYDAYLIAQARQAIAGQPFQTNLQDQVSDPSQMFAGGNMKGITSYMQCANNVMCYTLTATAKYNQEFAKAQDIAKNESSNGYLPTKVNGLITRPADLARSALTQMDQLGTQVIMNANTEGKDGLEGGLVQVTEGASISLASRLANYSISNSSQRDALRASNDQFPFSLSYSTAGGFGVNAGGVTANVGVGAIASQVQIGNTCATMYGDANAAGATVLIQGMKYNCATKTQVTGSGPSASFTPPTIPCTQDSQCNPMPIPDGTFKCVNNKCTL